MLITARAPIGSADDAVRPARDVPSPDAARVRSWVERLAIPRHFVAEPRANAWVRDQLADEFARQGYRVAVQGRYQNVVALPAELPEGAPVTLVAAHYDSVPRCPGADDNASALAVMLECARLLAGAVARRAGVGFVGFNAEEDGLLGSRDFVHEALPRFPHPIRAVHVLEMLGYRADATRAQTLPLPWVPASVRTPDFLALVGRDGSNPIVRAAAASRAVPRLRLVAARTWGPLHRVLPDLTRSDHFPFWCARVPAVLWTDTGNFRNPHYHQRSDTPDTLDYDFTTSAAALLCALLTTS